MATFDAFISYRRVGGAECAQLLYDGLSKTGLSVFMDKQELHFGDFRKQLILNNLRSRYLIVILSPGALDRCSNKGDWVRLELELALLLGKRIIPLKLDGFAFPDNLPKSLQRLKKLSQIPFNYVHPQTSIDAIKRILTKGWNQEDFEYIAEQRSLYAPSKKRYSYEQEKWGYYTSEEEACTSDYREDSANELLNHGFGTLFLILISLFCASYHHESHAYISFGLFIYLLFSWFCREEEAASVFFRKSFWGGLWIVAKKLLMALFFGLIFVVVNKLFSLAWLNYLPASVAPYSDALIVLMCIFVTASTLYVVYQTLLRLLHWINARLSVYFTSCLRRKRRFEVLEDMDTVAAIVSGVLAIAAEWLLSPHFSYRWFT